MKVCIYGAGAIGGHLAARLIAKGDCEVSVIARGPMLDAWRTKGVALHTEGRVIGGKPAFATDDPASLPPQDLVVVTLKAPSQPAVAAPLARLLGERGVALFAMNGLPWWWNHGLDAGGPLDLLDPGGALWNGVGPGRALGGVVNSSNQVTEPGVIVHTGTKRWIMGEPDNSASARLKRVVDLFSAAGLDGALSTDIRRDIWRKLMTNISGNPVAALTRLVAKDVATVPGLDEVAIALIDEALAVAAAHGCDLRGEIGGAALARPAKGRAPGKSSMLQDVEAGRAVEVDAIMGQVQVFGREKGVATPVIDTVCALLRGLDLSMKLAREAAGAK